jgi:hypothetical protein
MTENELYKRWQQYNTTCEDKDLPQQSYSDFADGYWAEKEAEMQGK